MVKPTRMTQERHSLLSSDASRKVYSITSSAMESTPGRHFDAEGSRCFKIDNELEFGRLQHRQFGGLGAFEDSSRIDADLTKHFWDVGSVAH